MAKKAKKKGKMNSGFMAMMAKNKAKSGKAGMTDPDAMADKKSKKKHS